MTFLEEGIATVGGFTASSREQGYSRMYADYLAGKPSVVDFYQRKSVQQVADRLDGIGFARDRMCGILRAQNSVYGASAATLENIERLRDKRTVCVLAGQQAGLFGGSLLTLFKALAAVKTAESHSRELQRPVVPVFWIEGDDHDFEEVNHTMVLNRQGEPTRIAYETVPDLPLPTAEIMFSDEGELVRTVELLKDCLGQSDFTDSLFDLIDRSYTPTDSFATAFGKFMAGLTGSLGLVLFSPVDPEVKRHAIPFFQAVLDRQDEIHGKIATVNGQIRQAGYHIQVEKRDSSTHLFCNLEGRRPLVRQGDGFEVGSELLARDELDALIESEPERFSPDVIARPLLQSYLFPTVSQKAGPAEMAYLAQVNPLFEVFDLPIPCQRARPTVTLVEKRIAEHMSRYGIKLDDLTGDIEQVVNRVLAPTFPRGLEDDYDMLRASVERQFMEFRDRALGFDSGLKEVARQTHGRIDFALKAFRNKLFSAHKKKSRQVRERIHRVANALYPNNALQERSLNVTFFLARYGNDVIRFLYDRIDTEHADHQLIKLSEYQP